MFSSQSIFVACLVLKCLKFYIEFKPNAYNIKGFMVYQHSAKGQTGSVELTESKGHMKHIFVWYELLVPTTLGIKERVLVLAT